jgi:hypothetical protein
MAEDSVGWTSKSRPTPVSAKIRRTAGARATSRNSALHSWASRYAPIRAVTPAQSQNVVVLMSTNTDRAPRHSTAWRSSPTTPATEMSISAGSVTSAELPAHCTGQCGEDMAATVRP